MVLQSWCVFQEELGFMLEVLGLREDALIQYDELDAMFDQFVANHASGGMLLLIFLSPLNLLLLILVSSMVINRFMRKDESFLLFVNNL
jgi:hypothetical protein